MSEGKLIKLKFCYNITHNHDNTKQKIPNEVCLQTININNNQSNKNRSIIKTATVVRISCHIS